MKIERIGKVIKVGDSLGIIIPAAVVRELKIRRGDHVGLVIADVDTIIAKRLNVIASDDVELRQDDTLPVIKNGE